MLPQLRRLPEYAGRRFAVYVGVIAHFHAPYRRVVELRYEVVGDYLRVVFQLVGGLDAGVDEVAARAEVGVPFVGRLRHEALVHQRHQRVAVVRARRAVGESGVVYQMRQTERGHKRLPVAVGLEVHQLNPAPVFALVNVGERVPRGFAVV